MKNKKNFVLLKVKEKNETPVKNEKDYGIKKERAMRYSNLKPMQKPFGSGKVVEGGYSLIINRHNH